MGTTHMIINVLDNTDVTMTTIIILMLTTLIMYRVMSYFNQPMVFGGVLAGVVISWLHLPKQYFDIASCGNMGEIGVNIYLMLLGAGFNYQLIRSRRGSWRVSLMSAIVPFASGILFAPFLYAYNKTSINQLEFSLIVGLCMSIASLSLISLFLNQTKLIEKPIGHIGLMAAGVDDLLFWLVYGGLLFVLQKDEIIRYNSLIIIAVYFPLIIFVAPRLVSYISSKITTTMMMRAFILCGCLISCVVADAANIHQVFGAFAFGLMLPRDNPLITQIRKNLEEFITVFFLPVFFAEVGILANSNLVGDINLLILGCIVSLVAFCSKFCAVYFPNTYLYKNAPGESAFLAALLNIRGVTEIIMMKIFYEVGFISNQIFTIFVVSAMLTTWVATSLVFQFRKYVP